jgi:hypothetical protein
VSRVPAWPQTAREAAARDSRFEDVADRGCLRHRGLGSFLCSSATADKCQDSEQSQTRAPSAFGIPVYLTNSGGRTGRSGFSLTCLLSGIQFRVMLKPGPRFRLTCSVSRIQFGVRLKPDLRCAAASALPCATCARRPVTKRCVSVELLEGRRDGPRPLPQEAQVPVPSRSKTCRRGSRSSRKTRGPNQGPPDSFSAPRWRSA